MARWLVLTGFLWVALGLGAQTKPLENIVFGSCAKQDQPQPFWQAILAQQPELFLFIGDNIYGDTEDMGVLREKYGLLGAQPGFQQLRAFCPILATWDDHDFGVNDGGAEYPKKAASKIEFLRFFPPGRGSDVRTRPGIYDSYMFGPKDKRVQVILLDTRTFRGQLIKKPRWRTDLPGRYVPNFDSTASLLGETQWFWFKQQLRKPARVRLIVTSIQAIPEQHGWEMWANLPKERARFFRTIRDTAASGVILVSGDRHLAEISRLDSTDANSVGYPLYEITSSGLNTYSGGSPSEPNHYRVGPGNYLKNNFGQIAIDWRTAEPRIRLTIRSITGVEVLHQDLRLSDMQSPY